MFDVRALIDHLLHWGPPFEAAARGVHVAPPAEAVDRTGGDWAKALLPQLDRTSRAWDVPEAWTGRTHMGGPMTYPSSWWAT